MKNKLNLCEINIKIETEALVDTSFVEGITSEDIAFLLVSYLHKKHDFTDEIKRLVVTFTTEENENEK